jgi:adenylate kinase family enzyme
MDFDLDHAQRIVITGNSGSGKSRLAQQLAQALAIQAIDLDQIHWMDGGYGSKRDDAAARQLVEKSSVQPRWVMEGVYGSICQVALQNATGLIWLDLPWEECRAGILQRGLRRRMTDADRAKLVAWAADYWARQTATSYTGHLRLFEAFGDWKIRLKGRSAADEFVAGFR